MNKRVFFFDGKFKFFSPYFSTRILFEKLQGCHSLSQKIFPEWPETSLSNLKFPWVSLSFFLFLNFFILRNLFSLAARSFIFLSLEKNSGKLREVKVYSAKFLVTQERFIDSKSGNPALCFYSNYNTINNTKCSN